jgi:hypothetical protein
LLWCYLWVNTGYWQNAEVKIQSLGSLKVTLHGTPADTEEELGKSNLKKVNVIYKPAKELKKTLN